MNQPTDGEQDLARLISRVRDIARELQPKHLQAASPKELDAFCEKAGSGPDSARMIVLAEDTAVELGSPKRASLSMVLWTREPGLVEDGRVSLVGPDLAELDGADSDYAQIALMEFSPEAEVNLFKLESAQYLTRKLPGVMARMMPGRLWIRASKQAMAGGLDFRIMGGALSKALREQGQGVRAVETLFVTSDRESIERFNAVASEAKILSGRHKKIMLGVDGDYECEELDCESCDEQEVCDEIRQVVAIRRKKFMERMEREERSDD